jgi:hypothetical protein
MGARRLPEVTRRAGFLGAGSLGRVTNMNLASPLARATLAFSLLAGCSLINAPDEINPGTGGAGATGGGGTGPGPGGGGSGGGPPCTEPADCASLTGECADGDCQMGVCVAVPRASGTPCGAAPTGDCDLADACDGAGQCTNLQVADGSFCGDCPAGPGLCGGCEAGTCSGCPSRATTKTFRHPLSASGWQLTGGWRVYSETPPASSGSLNGQCDNGLDDDGDGFSDLDDPGCVDSIDSFEFEPAACSDGFDGDGDGLIDLADPDCVGPGDDTEFPTGPIRFAHPVLGTDGNRAAPYGFAFQAPSMFVAGGGELEQSSATSPPTRIPANLEFLSWQMDEGSFFDLKAVQVSLDGTSFTTIAICPQGQPGAFPFCSVAQPSPPRAPDAWDFVSLAVPSEFVDAIGFVRFVLDTKDACCNWERGWYIDALNFAQDCACASDADCGFADGACGAGTCDTAVSECTLAPENLGGACDAPADAGCAEPICGDHGLCEDRSVAFDGVACDNCSTPPCDVCAASECLSCPVAQTIDFLDFSGWAFTGDMGVASCLAPNSVTPTDSPCFPAYEALGDPLTAPVLGSNGSRTGAPAPSNEVSSSTLRTAPTPLPAAITFKSWHQDRGGNDTFVPRDTKIIRVSVNGGGSFTTILNCDGNMTVPFCLPSTPNQNRALDQWDDVSIPVPMNLQGQVGIVEFAYDTVDSGQGWERGWYVDDLNLNTCDCQQQCPGVP